MGFPIDMNGISQISHLRCLRQNLKCWNYSYHKIKGANVFCKDDKSTERYSIRFNNPKNIENDIEHEGCELERDAWENFRCFSGKAIFIFCWNWFWLHGFNIL